MDDFNNHDNWNTASAFSEYFSYPELRFSEAFSHRRNNFDFQQLKDKIMSVVKSEKLDKIVDIRIDNLEDVPLVKVETIDDSLDSIKQAGRLEIIVTRNFIEKVYFSD